MRVPSIFQSNLRPSRADPEARNLRKSLEKEHKFEWVTPVVLGLLGITLAWDVTQDVAKAEEKYKQREKEEGDEGKKRKKERDTRRGSNRHRRDGDDDDDDDDGDNTGRGEKGQARNRRRRYGSLDREDQMERGGGRGWNRDRDDYRGHRSIGYDDYGYGKSYDFRRDDNEYENDYGRDRRVLDERRSRPRPRRRSSDW